LTQLALLVAYSVAQIGLGLWIARRVSTTSDFFVAGRGLGPGLIAATLLAANIGAGSTVGAAGLGWRDGLSAWWWVGSAGIGSVALALWVGPKMRALSARHDFKTVGDFLEWRYGQRVRIVVAVLLWFNTITILAAQLIAIATIVNVVAGFPKWVGCMLGGIVITTYFVAGGLMSSVIVNVVQLTVKFVGFAFALPLALAAVGGSAGLRAHAPTPDYWNFFQGGGSAWWIYLAMLAPAFVVSPGLLQKVFGARDDRAVRIGVGINAVCLLVFAALPVVLGMIARVLHPDLARQELALPTLLASDLPLAIGTLGLAAVFSAELSAADAILFMLATSLSKDLYKRFLNPSADDRRVLVVARAAAAAGGVLGVLLAIVAETIIGSLTVFYSLMIAILFVPIIGGLYARRLGPPEALAAIIAGVAALVVLQLGNNGGGIGYFTPPIIGLLAAILTSIVAVAVSRRAPPGWSGRSGRSGGSSWSGG
jgi:solute:Na+ symporter, SSS family